MMPINGFSSIAAHDPSDAREARGHHDASTESFAGLLAGAMHTHAPAVKAAKPKDGTSELEKANDADENATTENSSDVARADGTSTGGSKTVDIGSKAADSGNTAGGSDSGVTSAANPTDSTATPLISAIAAIPDGGTDTEPATAVASVPRRRPAEIKERAADPGSIDRSVTDLDPLLQSKVATVMARVQGETGLTVNVAETYRSQARQDALYAQGRDTAGPVVTWTQNSKHTDGRAVDLTLSGGSSASIADGYKALQRIASEEGLRTLGARDPGHLELPANLATSANRNTTSLTPVAPADASGPGQVSIAQVAQLARVADVSVAQPAQVARVATVARAATIPSVKTDASASLNGAAPILVDTGGGSGGGSNSQGRFGSGRDGKSGAGVGESRAYSALSAAVALRAGNTGAFSVPATSADSGSSAVDRTARVLAALEDAPARPLSQITMNVDAGNGATDRVQLSLRGASLNATIDTTDPRAAQAMSARSDELTRALTRDGIDLQSLHVRTGATLSGGSLTGASKSQSSSDSSSGSRFERGQEWQQADRQRSQQERRNQQREQRGDQSQ